MTRLELPTNRCDLRLADDNTVLRTYDQACAEYAAATSKYGRLRAAAGLRRVVKELRERGLPVNPAGAARVAQRGF